MTNYRFRLNSAQQFFTPLCRLPILRTLQALRGPIRGHCQEALPELLSLLIFLQPLFTLPPPEECCLLPSAFDVVHRTPHVLSGTLLFRPFPLAAHRAFLMSCLHSAASFFSHKSVVVSPVISSSALCVLVYSTPLQVTHTSYLPC